MLEAVFVKAFGAAVHECPDADAVDRVGGVKVSERDVVERCLGLVELLLEDGDAADDASPRDAWHRAPDAVAAAAPDAAAAPRADARGRARAQPRGGVEDLHSDSDLDSDF